mmetsp:Transcript_10903/g.19403  ORF Transcript_10903/g.19403 Transcript_10903/m.19403 type:complete len:82 (-) Transcript_10903:574-819(-)
MFCRFLPGVPNIWLGVTSPCKVSMHHFTTYLKQASKIKPSLISRKEIHVYDVEFGGVGSDFLVKETPGSHGSPPQQMDQAQ